MSSTSATLTFTEPNRTYPYSIGTEKGCNQSIASGTLAVQGSAVTASLSFSQQSETQTNKTQNSPGEGLLAGGGMTYLLVGIVLVVDLVAVAIALSRRKKS